MVPTESPSTRRRPRTAAVLTVAVGLAVLVGAGCSPPENDEVTAENCARPQSTSTTRGPVIAVLTDGASPATTQAVEALADKTAALFDSEVPGFDPGSSPADAEAGVVLLLTYGPTGAVETVGEYDLRGTGNDSTLREASARRTIRCLEIAAEGLAPAPLLAVPTTAAADGEAPAATGAALGGDLLRALGPTRDLVQAHAEESPAAIVAVGLGRSQVAGVPLVLTDLRDETRPEVLAQIAASGVHIPDLGPSGVGLIFLAPNEEVENSVSSAGIADFALDLCDATGAAPCGRTTTFGGPVEAR